MSIAAHLQFQSQKVENKKSAKQAGHSYNSSMFDWDTFSQERANEAFFLAMVLEPTSLDLQYMLNASSHLGFSMILTPYGDCWDIHPHGLKGAGFLVFFAVRYLLLGYPDNLQV